MTGRDLWEMREQIGQPTSPLKAIRANCLDCAGDSAANVRDCELTDCFLHPFRFGKNPFLKKRKLSAKQLAALRAGNKNRRKKSSFIAEAT